MPSRILVASGDDAVRKMLTRTLVRAGYQIIEVQTGEAALAAILDRRMGIMLAILDGQLPPVSGNRVVSALRKSGSRLPVILASGSFILDELSGDDDRVAFLSKPFQIEELYTCVEELLRKSRNDQPTRPAAIATRKAQGDAG